MRTTTMSMTALALLVALAFGPGAVGARAEEGGPKIVNGIYTFDRPTTVALLYGPALELGCTGTLIGCQTVLTAAHCVEGESAGGIKVYAQHAGMFAVSAIRIHPLWASEDADLAVLKLSARVTGIAPTAINAVADPATRAGTPGAIAGFGVSWGDGVDAGLKRAGKVTTARCTTSSGGELSDHNYVCWRYAHPIGAPGQDSNTCYGDSGGPLFLSLGGREVLAGVTSGGLVDDCGPGDVAYDANVYTYRAFVQQQLAGDSTVACGSLPAVGTVGTRVVGWSGQLGPGQEARKVFAVGAGASELRFGLNAEDDGSLNVDLYAKRGSSVSTSSYDCRVTGRGSFGVCRFAAPAAGAWSVLVRAAAGRGPFQVAATAFGAGVSATAGIGGRQSAAGSCRGACGGPADGSCWCDQECMALGDCCADAAAACPVAIP